MVSTKHLCITALAILVLPATAVSVSATVGGPRLARVLGWDPAEKRVYVQLQLLGESGEFGRVYYFALDSTSPAVPHRLAWSVADDAASTAAESLRVLERRLRAMPIEDATSIPQNEIVRSDTVRTDYYVQPRFVVRLGGIGEIPRWGDVEVTTYREPTLVFHRIYRVPGRKESVVILSFIGIPHEGGYETQTPILLRRDRPDTLHIEASSPYFR